MSPDLTSAATLFNERHTAMQDLLAGHIRERRLNFRGPEAHGGVHGLQQAVRGGGARPNRRTVYNGTPEGMTGPMERTLEEFEVQGLVKGAFGEMSMNVAALEEDIVAGMA